MSITGLIDCHNHSHNSPDAYDPVEKLCSHAIDNGVSVLTVTDHCEINAYYSDGYDKSSAASAREIAKTKAAFDGRLKLLCGVELGQPMQDIEAAERAVASQDYDFVIASLHNIDGKRDFYYLDYNKEDVYELLDRYYDELLRMAQWNKFDVLGHITYPLRYICGDFGIDVDMSRYDDIIMRIFEVLIKNGKGIEINTSGLRQKIGKTLPGFKYIKKFHDAGGRIITLGSDAHKAEDIGKGIRDGLILAKQAGFEQVCVFEKRIPVMLPIDQMI